MTTCPVCSAKIADMARRFDKDVCWVCPECFAFMQFSAKVLRRVGVRGVVNEPVRYLPETEKP